MSKIPDFFFRTRSDQKVVPKSLTSTGRERLTKIYKEFAEHHEGGGGEGKPPPENPVNPEDTTDKDENEGENEDEDDDKDKNKDKDEGKWRETGTPIDDHKSLLENGLVDKNGLPVSEGEIEILTKELLKKARQETTEHGYSSVPDSLRFKIEEFLRPKINWRQVLRNFVGQHIRIAWESTRKKQNRRFPDLPGRRPVRGARIWVAIDTSGSIVADAKMLYAFASEIDSMAKNAEIVAIDIDAGIQRVYEFDKRQVVFKGGGGTDFRPLWAALHEKGLPNSDPRDPKRLLRQRPDAIIYLTDGFGSYPEPSESGGVPALWVFTTKDYVGKQPFGHSVYLDPAV